MRALNANGQPDKTSVCKSFDPSKSMVNMTEEKLRGTARYSSVSRGMAASVQQKVAPVEGCKNPAVTVFRRPVRSQVGSQHEIETTLGLEEKARSTHTGSFELPSTIQTDFAHPTPFQGQITGLMSCGYWLTIDTITAVIEGKVIRVGIWLNRHYLIRIKL